MNLRDFYIRVCKLIEEFTNTSNITDDEDIRAKLPVLTSQGIKKILQAKPILRFANLLAADAEEVGDYLLYPLPADLYRLRVVELYGEEYFEEYNGNANYIRVRKRTNNSDIYVRYEAFHTEIDMKLNIDSKENENFIIELTDDCFPILENFVAMGLTTDSTEQYGHFFNEYQSGMQNLQEGRQKKLVQFEEF